jgi:GNAT superfamily N-acetyltransferase
MNAVELNDSPVGLLASPPVTPFAPDEVVRLTEGSRLAGRCSLWWRSVPVVHGRDADRVGCDLPAPVVGVIGDYAAIDGGASRALLDRACARLADEGCTVAVGPMDGSTWRRYRFVTERGSEPPFFLEPDNPDEAPLEFAAAGFTTVATYASALATDLDAAAGGWRDSLAAMRDRGIVLRPLNPDRVDDELRALYSVSLLGFRDNFLSSPITEDDFRRVYRALLPSVDPGLVTIATVDRQPVGFLLAIPDVLELQRRPAGPGRTVVLKSLALLPAWRGIGLGRLLFSHAHAVAAARGYTRAIHALMREGSRSHAMSAIAARPIRRYALFARAL